MKANRTLFISLYFILGLLLWGCSAQTQDSEGEPTTETAEATVPAAPTAEATQPTEGAEIETEIKLFQFETPLEVEAGDKIRWLNQDAIIHSVTSGEPDAPSGVFDTDFFDQGESAEVTFDEPGTYSYFCKRHNFMQGEVVVR